MDEISKEMASNNDAIIPFLEPLDNEVRKRGKETDELIEKVSSLESKFTRMQKKMSWMIQQIRAHTLKNYTSSTFELSSRYLLVNSSIANLHIVASVIYLFHPTTVYHYDILRYISYGSFGLTLFAFVSILSIKKVGSSRSVFAFPILIIAFCMYVSKLLSIGAFYNSFVIHYNPSSGIKLVDFRIDRQISNHSFLSQLLCISIPQLSIQMINTWWIGIRNLNIISILALSSGMFFVGSMIMFIIYYNLVLGMQFLDSPTGFEHYDEIDALIMLRGTKDKFNEDDIDIEIGNNDNKYNMEMNEIKANNYTINPFANGIDENDNYGNDDDTYGKITEEIRDTRDLLDQTRKVLAKTRKDGKEREKRLLSQIAKLSGGNKQ